MESIKQMCLKVGDELGKGFSENIYQESIGVMLRQAGMEYSKEVTMQVKFRDLVVGTVRADLVIPREHIIIECKAIDGNLKISHLPQLVNYLEITKYTKGIFVNFNQNPSKTMVEIIIVKRSESDVYEAEMVDGETVYINGKGILIE